jgi:hypothetical protein
LGPDGFKVFRQPLETLDDSSAHYRVLALKVSDRRIQDAKVVHRLGQPEPARYFIEILPSLSGGNVLLLTPQPIPQGVLEVQSLVRISEKLDQLLFDEISHHRA